MANRSAICLCGHTPGRAARRGFYFILAGILWRELSLKLGWYGMARLELTPDDLRPLIRLVVDEIQSANEADAARLKGRLAYPEPEAAALLGVRPHVLRDARLRGELDAATVGKRIVYTVEALKDYLRRNRWEPT